MMLKIGPAYETKRRAEAESLPQRRRGAEISAEKGEERSITEITETLVSRSGCTAIRAVRSGHGVHLTTKPIPLRLCVSALKKTADDVSQPDHETRERAETESLPQRRRGAEITEKFVSHCTISRTVRFKHGVHLTTKLVSLLSLRSNPRCLSLRLCVSALKRTADDVSQPDHETRKRAEAESLTQRRRDAEITETLVSRSGYTAIRAVRFRHGVHLTTKPVSLLSLRSNALRLSLRLSLRLCVSALKKTADLTLVPA